MPRISSEKNSPCRSGSRGADGVVRRSTTPARRAGGAVQLARGFEHALAGLRQHVLEAIERAETVATDIPRHGRRL